MQMSGYLALVGMDRADFTLNGLYQLKMRFDSQARVILVRWRPPRTRSEQQPGAADADLNQAGAVPI